MKNVNPRSGLSRSVLVAVGLLVGLAAALPVGASAASLQETAQRLFPQSKVETVEPSTSEHDKVLEHTVLRARTRFGETFKLSVAGEKQLYQ